MKDIEPSGTTHTNTTDKPNRSAQSGVSVMTIYLPQLPHSLHQKGLHGMYQILNLPTRVNAYMYAAITVCSFERYMHSAPLAVVIGIVKVWSPHSIMAGSGLYRKGWGKEVVTH